MSIFREFELPGFRFHPTEQELLDFYLLNTVTGNPACFDIIGFLNIYHYDPGQLPKLAMHGEREWYFFVPRDRKIGGSGGRPKRTTGNGFWKATGLDRKIISLTGHKRVIGHKKTLVFYQGKAPQGKKTDWIMNEYRLPDNSLLSKEVVLCKIYRKAIPLKVMEERAAMEESLVRNGVFQSQVIDLVLISVNHQQQDMQKELVGGASVKNMQNVVFKMEEEDEGGKVEDDVKRERVAEKCVFEREKLAEIQVPKLNLEWTQDAFWSQLDSPWLPNLTPNFANIINLY